MKIEANL